MIALWLSELTNAQYHSWLAFNETANLLGTLDPNDPAAAEQGPIRVENLFNPPENTGIIDWYVEAIGTVPEPTSLTLLVAAGSLFVRRRY